MRNEIIEFDDIKKRLEEIGYYANEELQYETFLSMFNFSSGKKSEVQDIYAACLEGPPGAGKSFFVKTYTKLLNSLYDDSVELLSYQCDVTTGKEELYEDIHISSAVKGDYENVNTPGIITRAINTVNEGHKVILFLDEYDKAREETDTFMLDFLQSGEIYTTQHGYLKIKEEYKTNLQVFLCKNDFREELTGPLSRRLRISRLDHMLPETFNKVATKILVTDTDKPVSEELINLVSIIYNSVYENRELFKRLPAASEMIIGIQDADNLIKNAAAPGHITYKTIIKNMFKNEDDINTLENSNLSFQDTKINDFINSMKNVRTSDEEMGINELIALKVFKDQGEKFTLKTDEAIALLNEYKEKLKELESLINKEKNKGIKKEDVDGFEYDESDKPSDLQSLFDDQKKYVKRGINVFSQSEDWISIGSYRIGNNSKLHQSVINNIISNSHISKITVYENGFLLDTIDDIKLVAIVSNIKNKFEETEIRFFADNYIIPANFIKTIFESSHSIFPLYDERDSLNLSCLIYHDKTLDNEIFEETSKEGTYKVKQGLTQEEFSEIRKQLRSEKNLPNNSSDDLASKIVKTKLLKKDDRVLETSK